MRRCGPVPICDVRPPLSTRPLGTRLPLECLASHRRPNTLAVYWTERAGTDLSGNLSPPRRAGSLQRFRALRCLVRSAGRTRTGIPWRQNAVEPGFHGVLMLPRGRYESRPSLAARAAAALRFGAPSLASTAETWVVDGLGRDEQLRRDRRVGLPGTDLRQNLTLAPGEPQWVASGRGPGAGRDGPCAERAQPLPSMPPVSVIRAACAITDGHRSDGAVRPATVRARLPGR
jgi:hypothetical protein